MKIPTERVHTCKYCTPSVTHFIDPIVYPSDIYAEKDDKGQWKCGNCIDMEIQDRIVRVIPTSNRAKEILADRKREEQKKLQFRNWEARIKKMHGRLVR
jgi:Fe-S-cluster-containing hydrogenase component 2